MHAHLDVSEVSETMGGTRKANAVTNTLLPLARPILKWAGGKTQLLPEIASRAPKSFSSYHEPFVGSGAVFFSLSPVSATISDTNANLVSLYTHVRDNTVLLFEALQALQEEFNELPSEEKSAHYYSKRALFNAEANGSIHQSALMVFLNKTGFNGMYRENPKGEFNIPFAKKETVNLPTYEHLEACKSVLERADIIHTGFESIVERAKSGDFVYFDPPYVPLTKTSSFTSYQAKGFSLNDHEKLAQTFSSLHDSGVKVLLSNSDTPEVRRIFKGFTIETVYARRSINSKGSGRGTVAEVLVRNY